MTYEFKEQIRIGALAEQRVRSWLQSINLIVESSNFNEDNGGVDMIVSGLDKSGRHATVDIKSDCLAHKTGNFFIEVMSKLETGTPSWLYKPGGKWIFFCIPQTGDLYMVKKDALRRALFTHWKKLQWKTVQNQGYSTVGVPVPISQVERIATKKVRLAPWK